MDLREGYSDPLDSPAYWLWHASPRWTAALTRALQEVELTPVQFFALGGLAWLTSGKSSGVSQKALDPVSPCSTAPCWLAGGRGGPHLFSVTDLKPADFRQLLEQLTIHNPRCSEPSDASHTIHFARGSGLARPEVSQPDAEAGRLGTQQGKA